MRTFISRFLLPLVYASFAFGCSHPATSTPVDGARLHESEVIRIAANAAQNHGYRLVDFKEPRARYEFVHKDKNWTVFFDGKAAAPGNHFMVWVDDRTGKAQVMPGE